MRLITFSCALAFLCELSLCVDIEIAKPPTSTTEQAPTTLNATTIITTSAPQQNATSSTESTTLSTTTIAPKNDTTTAPATTSVPPTVMPAQALNKYLNRRNEKNSFDSSCRCDFLVNVCETNCCCDLDCSKKTIAVFDCSAEEITHQEYDYTGGLQSCQISGGILCIAHSNFKSQTMRFYDPTFSIGSRRWPQIFPPDSDEDKKINSVYELNEQILLYNESTKAVEVFKIPKPIGDKCLASEPVRWLRSSETSCIKTHGDFLSDASYLLSKLNRTRILSHPVELSTEYHCGVNCLNISLTVDGAESNFTGFKFLNESNEAFITFTVWHNYTHVHELNLNLRTPMERPFVKVNYEIQFQAVESKPFDVYPVSGHPGYVLGKPILSAKAISLFPNATDEREKTKSVMDFFIFRNGSEPYQANRTFMISTSSQGKCKPNELGFGANIFQKCHVHFFASQEGQNLTELCMEYQNQIFRDLLPNFVNSTNELEPVFVSEHGAPNNDSRSWIKLNPPQLKDSPVGAKDGNDSFICSNMVIDIGYEFFFARLSVAGVHNQKVLQKVRLQLRPKVDLRFSSKDSNTVPVYTQVQFLDATATSEAISLWNISYLSLSVCVFLIIN